MIEIRVGGGVGKSDMPLQARIDDDVDCFETLFGSIENLGHVGAPAFELGISARACVEDDRAFVAESGSHGRPEFGPIGEQQGSFSRKQFHTDAFPLPVFDTTEEFFGSVVYPGGTVERGRG